MDTEVSSTTRCRRGNKLGTALARHVVAARQNSIICERLGQHWDSRRGSSRCCTCRDNRRTSVYEGQTYNLPMSSKVDPRNLETVTGRSGTAYVVEGPKVGFFLEHCDQRSGVADSNRPYGTRDD
jgi:hypothetical protein